MEGVCLQKSDVASFGFETMASRQLSLPTNSESVSVDIA
jgi:hypothetical protein